MIHPDTEIKTVNPRIGLGVFATKFIPEGTIVYVKDPFEIMISTGTYNQLEEPLKSKVEKYSYIDEMGNRVLSWDHGKYVNHCCESNTISTGYGFEIAIVDIHPGEEITDEYGLFNLEGEMLLCCEKTPCRMSIKSDDIGHYSDIWDSMIKRALKRFWSVDQPLLPLMNAHTLHAVSLFLEDPQKYISVRALLNLDKEISMFSNNDSDEA